MLLHTTLTGSCLTVIGVTRSVTWQRQTALLLINNLTGSTFHDGPALWRAQCQWPQAFGQRSHSLPRLLTGLFLPLPRDYVTVAGGCQQESTTGLGSSLSVTTLHWLFFSLHSYQPERRIEVMITQPQMCGGVSLLFQGAEGAEHLQTTLSIWGSTRSTFTGNSGGTTRWTAKH